MDLVEKSGSAQEEVKRKKVAREGHGEGKSGVLRGVGRG